MVLTPLSTCSLAEELVTAAQAVESGKGLERKLSTLQTEVDTQANSPWNIHVLRGVPQSREGKPQQAKLIA